MLLRREEELARGDQPNAQCSGLVTLVIAECYPDWRLQSLARSNDVPAANA